MIQFSTVAIALRFTTESHGRQLTLKMSNASINVRVLNILYFYSGLSLHY